MMGSDQQRNGPCGISILWPWSWSHESLDFKDHVQFLNVNTHFAINLEIQVKYGLQSSNSATLIDDSILH